MRTEQTRITLKPNIPHHPKTAQIANPQTNSTNKNTQSTQTNIQLYQLKHIRVS